MRGDLHYEERVNVAYEMLNHTPPMYGRLKLRPALRRELDRFTRRVMEVLIGQRAAVPRDLRRYVRPMRRSR
jgi:hypothetical protein